MAGFRGVATPWALAEITKVQLYNFVDCLSTERGQQYSTPATGLPKQ